MRFEDNLESAFSDEADGEYDVLDIPEDAPLEYAGLALVFGLTAAAIAAAGGYAGYRLGGRRFGPAIVGAVGAPVAAFFVQKQLIKVRTENTKQCIQDYCNANPKFCKRRSDGVWELFFTTCERAVRDGVPGGRECRDTWNRCHGRR